MYVVEKLGNTTKEKTTEIEEIIDPIMGVSCSGVGRRSRGCVQTGGRDSVSPANRYVSEERKRPAGARIWARRALKF